MNELTLHPNVYATGTSRGLVNLLEKLWVREHSSGVGTIFVISGFGNYNGGVRFFETFREHSFRGGKIVAVFAGSASARLTSKQLVDEMLRCGADVHVVSRKKLMHAKCYGVWNDQGQSVIVTSGNFTGPGMSQNVEMSVLLDAQTSASMNFSWKEMIAGLLGQDWMYYKPQLINMSAPDWSLLYDEEARDIVIDETEELTMLLSLSHADTVRINAAPGSTAARGSQYFWLSKDCYGFFPPLTIRNARGLKATYSCLIEMNYVDLNFIEPNCRVTFEAEKFGL